MRKLWGNAEYAFQSEYSTRRRKRRVDVVDILRSRFAVRSVRSYG